jgi:hypothetical protein
MNRLVPVIVAMSAVAAVAAGEAVPAARAVPAAISRAAVTGLGALSTAGNAEVSSVSCTPAGYCAAGGSGQQAFVAAERDGRWGTAARVPSLAALNTGGSADVLPGLGAVTWVRFAAFQRTMTAPGCSGRGLNPCPGCPQVSGAASGRLGLGG